MNFLKAMRPVLGLSIDGPRNLHDIVRRDRLGRGTHARIMANVAVLREEDINFSVLCTLGKHNINSPCDVFSFFEENDIVDIGFNPEELMGIHSSESDIGSDMNGSPAYLTAIEDFFYKYISLIDTHRSKQRVRELNLIYTNSQRPYPLTPREALPGAILTCTLDGRLYAFSPDSIIDRHRVHGDLSIGSVFDTNAFDLRNNRKFQDLSREVAAGLYQCSTVCSYFTVCGGGRPASKLSEFGHFDVSESNGCQKRLKAPANALRRFFKDKIVSC
jgi:uncharacterized protein